MLDNFKRFLKPFSINPILILKTFWRYPSYFSDYYKLTTVKDFKISEFPINSFFPCIHDKYDESGQAKGHYFHQDLFVANCIYKNSPLEHYDVGSRIDGFVSHVASFRKIHVIDIRILNSTSENIEYIQADLMSTLPITLIESTDSLSCLHTIEHFGLGRYGDPINWNGHILGFNSLIKMLKPDGKLYFSTPIGPQRIEFNAHRVFSIEYLIDTLFKNKVEVLNFSFVDDIGDLHKNVELNIDNIKSNYNCIYGCGIFELKKL
jgi:SAM-dependent methyltransferase